MTFVTDMVIYTHRNEAAAMKRLNAWCAENDAQRQQEFCELDSEDAGGWKAFCGHVWAMADNHFPAWELVEVFGTFGWLSPETTVLLVTREDDEAAGLYRADQPVAK